MGLATRRQRERVPASSRLILVFLEIIRVLECACVVRVDIFIALCLPALVTVQARHTEAPSHLDPLWIELSQTVLNIHAFLSRMLTNLVEDAG